MVLNTFYCCDCWTVFQNAASFLSDIVMDMQLRRAEGNLEAEKQEDSRMQVEFLRVQLETSPHLPR